MKRIDRVRPELQSIFSYLTIRIIQATYESFIVPSGASFVPALAPTDICRTCVEDTFLGGFITSRFWNRRDITSFQLEKLYQYQHPRHVAQFDAVVNEVDSIGHWVSRRWLKGAYRLFFLHSHEQNRDVEPNADWRQPKPKMHAPSQNDPAPDSQGFRDNVVCEHGGLALNISARTRISQEVRQPTLRPGNVLMTLRPSHCSRHSFHHGRPCPMLSAHVLSVLLSQRTPTRIKGSYGKRPRKKRLSTSPSTITNITH